MATKGATKRLSKEYMLIQQSPPPFLIAKPIESNILEWHYVLRGPPDTPYEGGEYHGKLVFPSDYPFKPPSIRMTTPSGRFQTDTKLCLSMSDFHPGSWNPSWSVSTILTGLLSFMTANESTTGSIKTSDADKKIYAARSHEFNLKDRKFMEVFPELCTPQLAPLPPINGTSSSTQDKSSTPNPQPIAIAKTKTTITTTTTTATTTTTTVTQRTTAPASSREPQRAAVPTTDGNRDTRWFSFEPWHKILVFIALCLYLLAAKVMSRSSGLS